MPAPARDLLDIATYAGEIALTLEWASKGLGEAYAEGEDLHAARRVALDTLRLAAVALAALIDELAEGSIEQDELPPSWPQILDAHEAAIDAEIAEPTKRTK